MQNRLGSDASSDPDKPGEMVPSSEDRLDDCYVDAGPNETNTVADVDSPRDSLFEVDHEVSLKVFHIQSDDFSCK